MDEVIKKSDKKKIVKAGLGYTVANNLIKA